MDEPHLRKPFRVVDEGRACRDAAGTRRAIKEDPPPRLAQLEHPGMSEPWGWHQLRGQKDARLIGGIPQHGAVVNADEVT